MVKIKRILLFITLILVVAASLGIYVYINKPDKVVQAEEQVNNEKSIDNKAKDPEVTINKETVESLTVKELFIKCLKVSCNVEDTSNAEEMEYIKAFQKEKFRKHYVDDVMPNCYSQYKTLSLKDYEIKEIKAINNITDTESEITYNGYMVYYTATVILDGKVEVWDNEAIITYEDEKYLIATFKIR